MRRSPATIASYRPAAPRLACVKPVASVHPEPGSNSSLEKMYLRMRDWQCIRHHNNRQSLALSQNDYPNPRIETVRFFYPTYSRKVCRFLYYFCLCKSFKELFFSSPRSESGCKGTNFFRTGKTFSKKFSSFMQNLSHSWQISRHKKAYTLLIYIKEEKFRMIRAARVIRENKGIICLEIWRIKKKAVPLRPINE